MFPSRWPDTLLFLLLLVVGGSGLLVAAVGAGWMLYALLAGWNSSGARERVR